MYQPPTIYGGSKTILLDTLKRTHAPLVILGQLQQEALEEVVRGANEAGDYLDPNSITVRITVEARAL